MSQQIQQVEGSHAQQYEVTQWMLAINHTLHVQAEKVSQFGNHLHEQVISQYTEMIRRIHYLHQLTYYLYFHPHVERSYWVHHVTDYFSGQLVSLIYWVIHFCEHMKLRQSGITKSVQKLQEITTQPHLQRVQLHRRMRELDAVVVAHRSEMLEMRNNLQSRIATMHVEIVRWVQNLHQRLTFQDADMAERVHQMLRSENQWPLNGQSAVEFLLPEERIVNARSTATINEVIVKEESVAGPSNRTEGQCNTNDIRARRNPNQENKKRKHDDDGAIAGPSKRTEVQSEPLNLSIKKEYLSERF